MRISDALLYCIWKSGGTVTHYQFQKWIKTLVETEHIRNHLVGGDDVVHMKITEKGVKRLIAHNIIEEGLDAETNRGTA